MKTIKGYLILSVLVLTLPGCQYKNKNAEVMRMEDDSMFVVIDRRWDSVILKKVRGQYDLDSGLLDAALMNQKKYTIDSITWIIKEKGRNLIELSKPFLSENFLDLKINDLNMFDELFQIPGIISGNSSKKPGYNKFSQEKAFTYKDTLATFFLKGHLKAENVSIAGSFNSWSTYANQMRKTDKGWIAEIRLLPGRYFYKYYIDGRWITDPSDEQAERTESRDMVSVVYCPNYVFRLAGYPDAKKVVVTGNFMNWVNSGIAMSQKNGEWLLPVYLKEGTHVYKFIADGKWLTDPSNPDIRSDGDGNLNSFLSIGNIHRFELKGFEDAEKVIVSGTFNNWSQNELLMKKNDGGWSLDYALPSGNFEYKYIVDGHWMPDPANPNTTGSGDYVNSILLVDPNYTFILNGFENAENVIVTGSFNNWSTEKYRMNREGGKWRYSLRLEPAKYTYKFIVDGQWMLDPANDLWEDNQYGTGNSVLWFEQ